MKKRKAALIIAGVLIILVAAIAWLAWLNRAGGELDANQIEIYVQGEAAAALTLADLQTLPMMELDKEIVSSSGDNQAGLFRGVALVALLDAAAPGWQVDATSVVCRASDNFTSGFDLDEVLTKGNIMVAYALDGQLLPGQEDGGKGPFRLVIRDDEFGNRSTFWLCRIEVQ
ncbi:MAG TPA: molybdopterin-dependent oxidoreductase [Clostridiales bacterium]|jgi:hypothetical protein|nr:molybdopterin-dependent oxidoreductase [Clostridiales bacterium]